MAGEKEEQHHIDLGTILKVATEKNATDIHLQVGLPPVLRIQKKLVALGSEKLSPERVEELVFPIMNDHQKMLFKQNMEYDFSYGVKGLA
jgi:twitching motility protein PilT